MSDILVEDYSKYNLTKQSVIKVSKLITIEKSRIKHIIFEIEKETELESLIKKNLTYLFGL